MEGRKGEGDDSAGGGTLNATPCGSASIGAGPVREEVGMGIGLAAKESESMCVIVGKSERWCDDEE